MNNFAKPRRRFLSDMGTGFASLALGAMLQKDGIGAESGWAPPDGLAHFAPKAKSVIWLFMAGGVSQVETFDPKPELTKHGGKTIPNTPFGSVLESPYIKNRVELVKDDANGKIYDKLYPLQVGYRKRGESGIEVSDWLPHISECVDDMAIVRSMWTTASNHDAQLQFHTGRNRFDGFFPTIGSWVHYGLGSLNDNLPQFIVMGNKIGDCCGGKGTEGADYLGPGVIHRGNRGATVVGELDGAMTDRVREIHDHLRIFEPDAVLTDNIFGFLWGKLAYAALLFATALTDESQCDLSHIA